MRKGAIMTGNGLNAGFGAEQNPDAGIVGRSIGAEAKLAQVKMAELDFSSAKTLQPIGFRFIIPVPDLGAENQVIEVTNWKGEKESIVGYGFRNGEDKALQAVSGDGKGVIIALLNPEKIDLDAASKAILGKIGVLGGAGSLTVEKLDTLLDFIRTVVGADDLYNSEDSIAENMVPQEGLSVTGGRPLGLFEKKDKAGPLGVFVEGACAVLDGPHAGSAQYDEGFMAVQIPPKKEGQPYTYRSVSPDAITSCYRLADGTPLINPKEQLPVVPSV